MPSVLVIGATRGLGASLAKKYGEAGWVVYGTTRSAEGPEASDAPADVKWIPNVDLLEKGAGLTISNFLDKSKPLDIVVRASSITVHHLSSSKLHELTTSADCLRRSLYDRGP
jgi:NAD(P)-dependent dehydrogenase (short-subunit alcohol dehydrogenase family)